MTRECRPASAGEQRKSVRQAIHDLLHAEDSGSDRREFNRQRQTVEPAAQRDDHRLVRAVELEGARCRSRPLTKQHHGFVLSQLSEWLRSVSWRDLQRRNGVDWLAWNLGRPWSGGVKRQPGGGARASGTRWSTSPGRV